MVIAKYSSFEDYSVHGYANIEKQWKQGQPQPRALVVSLLFSPHSLQKSWQGLLTL